MTSIRHIVRDKWWHPHAQLFAPLRALYWVLIRRYPYELCARCGRPVRVVYHAPDWIWETFSGFSNAARSPGGEAGGGVLCIPCLNDLFAQAPGGGFLRWTCRTDDEWMRDQP